MIPEKIELEIVTPERLVLREEIDEVILPSVDGYMGVRPGHVPLLAILDAGEVSYRNGSTTRYLSVSGGYAEVLRDSVSVLAVTCERSEEIDLPRAERSRDDARRLLEEKLGEQEFQRAEVQLKRAISRIQVHGRLEG